MVNAAVTQKKDVPHFKGELAALAGKIRDKTATEAEIAHFVQKYRGFGSIYDPCPKHMFEKQPLEIETIWGALSEKGAKIIGEQMAKESVGWYGC